MVYAPWLLIEMPQKVKNVLVLHGILRILKTALLAKVSQISKFRGSLEDKFNLNSSLPLYESETEILQSSNRIVSQKLAKFAILARNVC